MFLLIAEVTKPDKSCRDFCFFVTFFSKKKVSASFESRRLS